MKQRRLEQEHIICVCGGKSCTKEGSKKLYKKLKKCLEEEKLERSVCLQRTACMGHCDKGPNVMLFPQAHLLHEVKRGDVSEVLALLKLTGEKLPLQK